MTNYRLLNKQSPIYHLTPNERRVMRLLLDDARVSDVEIGKRLKISPQGANKIRKKLESTGLIEGYLAEVNYGALGVNVLALVLLDIPKDSQNEKTFFDAISEKTIFFYKVLRNGISHIALCGFKDIEELDNYFNHLNLKQGMEIKKIHVFAHKKMTKNSTRDLIAEAIRSSSKDAVPELERSSYGSEIEHVHAAKLSPEEKRILMMIARDGRMNYRKISSELKTLTPRAISKVRERLEAKKVLNGFSIKTDYNKLGIGLISFMFLKTMPGYEEYKDDFKKLVKKSPQITGCYNLHEGSLCVLRTAFRDIHELETFSENFHDNMNGAFQISQMYISPSNGVISDNNRNFVKGILGQ